MIGLSTIPVGGAQHDMRIFRESNVNNMFRDAQVNSPFQGIMYGDKAYTAWTHARGLQSQRRRARRVLCVLEQSGLSEV